ncbi:MAG: Transcriptional regulator MraZ [Chlamydiia bacterium]|nr:Transcriptional regulator MraZ [Chlamydiia bacterium]
MSKAFFSGSYKAKLDEKSRFVLPQNLRYMLVEEGKLEFSIGLSMGGCLAIYRTSEIQALVEKFQKRKHVAKFQKFFTLFFSTLITTTCDKVGRVSLPESLQKSIGIDKELMITGAMDKIEIWPKEKYEKLFNVESMEPEAFDSLMEEAFGEEEETKENSDLEKILEKMQTTVKV